jgi:hypothetical protein
MQATRTDRCARGKPLATGMQNHAQELFEKLVISRKEFFDMK